MAATDVMDLTLDSDISDSESPKEKRERQASRCVAQLQDDSKKVRKMGVALYLVLRLERALGTLYEPMKVHANCTGEFKGFLRS